MGLISLVNRILSFGSKKARVAWGLALLSQIVLAILFPSEAILILAASVVGWFGALFFLVSFMSNVVLEKKIKERDIEGLPKV